MMMMIVVVELVTMTSLCYTSQTSLNTGQGSTPETSVSNKNLKI